MVYTVVTSKQSKISEKTSNLKVEVSKTSLSCLIGRK